MPNKDNAMAPPTINNKKIIPIIAVVLASIMTMIMLKLVYKVTLIAILIRLKRTIIVLKKYAGVAQPGTAQGC